MNKMFKIKKTLMLLSLILLNSCVFNLKIKAVRFINDSDDIELANESNLFLKSLNKNIDTLLTLKSSSCHSDEEEYIIHIYKEAGVTKSKIISDQATYPLIPILKNFNWDTILSAKNLILTQKPKPHYWASVIEGDTIWRNSFTSSTSGELSWEFTMITNQDTLNWFTMDSERFGNPSMEVTKIFKYVMSESYNKIWSYSDIYGKKKYKKKPIIGRRDKD